ncbi:ABC transporter substrate-binding protein [Natronosalvus caseinilyticus]|uniref:ABC transporter substrate-binding protein n=1 Tax=Natronosalvus caseinilyticus TaxID=2953747 RepID=UPI0028AD4726|nr:ABC transporter substrate-binding protein [Natronosalvus caseinilyticus]
MAWEDSAIRRRQIIKGAAAGGSAFVAGCLGGGGGEEDGGGSINFVHIASFEPSANDFKEAYDSQSDATLEVQATPAESSSSREYYVNQFAAQSSEFDVGMMDVVWPAEFVDAGWAAEVDDPDGLTDEMLETPVETVTIDDSLYGMPMFTDANGLYYRTDLLEEAGYDEPPSTYMELVDMAQDIMDQSDEDLNGYIWQGGANEGLTIMWLNWLWGMGGSVQGDDGNLVVNSEEGVEALQHAVDLIYEYEITPESIPSSGTDGNRQTFQQGNTIFMRNWPYAYALFQDDTPVTDNFAVTTMPKAEGNEDAPNSCIGGWSLFINSFSENQSAAQELANYVGSPEAQEQLAAERSRLPVRQELYEDGYWEDSDADKPAFLDRFSEILDQTSARPAIPNYSQWSNIVYTECNNALTEQKSPQQALDDAQDQIDSDINDA